MFLSLPAFNRSRTECSLQDNSRFWGDKLPIFVPKRVRNVAITDERIVLVVVWSHYGLPNGWSSNRDHLLFFYFFFPSFNFLWERRAAVILLFRIGCGLGQRKKKTKKSTTCCNCFTCVLHQFFEWMAAVGKREATVVDIRSSFSGDDDNTN